MYYFWCSRKHRYLIAIYNTYGLSLRCQKLSFIWLFSIFCFAQVYERSTKRHETQKLGNTNVPYYKKKNTVELKRSNTPGSYRVYNLMEIKPQKERQFLILEYGYITWKTCNSNSLCNSIWQRYMSRFDESFYKSNSWHGEVGSPVFTDLSGPTDCCLFKLGIWL